MTTSRHSLPLLLQMTYFILFVYLLFQHLAESLTEFPSQKNEVIMFFVVLFYHVLDHNIVIFETIKRRRRIYHFSSVHSSCSVVSDSCHPMDCSMPGFPVHHQLLELAQTHVHQVGCAIQPSHPLLFPSPPTFNLSQCQGLFQWVSSSHQVVKVFGASASVSVLQMNTQDWFPLRLTGLISLLSKGLSRVFSSTTMFSPSIILMKCFREKVLKYQQKTGNLNHLGIFPIIFLLPWLMGK